MLNLIWRVLIFTRKTMEFTTTHSTYTTIKFFLDKDYTWYSNKCLWKWCTISIIGSHLVMRPKYTFTRWWKVAINLMFHLFKNNSIFFVWWEVLTLKILYMWSILFIPNRLSEFVDWNKNNHATNLLLCLWFCMLSPALSIEDVSRFTYSLGPGHLSLKSSF